MSPLPFLCNIDLEILTTETRIKNKITDINFQKEEVEVENLRDLVTKRKKIDLYDLGKVAG